MEILSPAKINLFLAVTGKRPDGYHDLVTLYCRVGIYDKLIMDMDQKGIAVWCRHPDVPSDSTNTAYRAAEIFFSNLKPERHLSGIKITIEKKIPVGAGLGGGSSNAAGVLLALNQYHNFPFSTKRLMEMGTEVGADVPFFIFQTPAIGRGIGNRLTPYDGLKPFSVLLVYPNRHVSTREVYKKLNLGLTKCEQKLNCLLFKNRAFNADCHLCNDLETITESLCPDVPLIKEQLRNLGAEGVLMTGSGPTVFGLFSCHENGRAAYEDLSKDKSRQVFLADLLI